MRMMRSHTIQTIIDLSIHTNNMEESLKELLEALRELRSNMEDVLDVLEDVVEEVENQV